jgi:hypothetical protein
VTGSDSASWSDLGSATEMATGSATETVTETDLGSAKEMATAKV